MSNRESVSGLVPAMPTRSPISRLPGGLLRRLPGRLRTTVGDEHGFGLVELLVVLLIFPVVLLGTYFMVRPTFNAQGRTSQRATTTQAASVALERMAREIRNATSLTVGGTGSPQSTAGKIDLVTSGEGGATINAQEHVIYDCTSGSCTRAASAPGQPSGAVGTALPVLSGVSNPSTVYAGQDRNSAPAATNPFFVSLKLDVGLGSGFTNPVELQDGVTVENLLP